MTELSTLEHAAIADAEAGAVASEHVIKRAWKARPRVFTHKHSRRWKIVHSLATLSMAVYIVADHGFGFTLAILGHAIWLWVDDEPAPQNGEGGA